MAGLSDTRLGDDATETCRIARGTEARARGEALMKAREGLGANQRAAAFAARTGATRVNCLSFGEAISVGKDRLSLWRHRGVTGEEA